MESSVTLSGAEQAALDRLEDEQSRGETVKWDEPKAVRGVVVRDIETVKSRDKEGNPKTSRVLTLRTSNGLQAIFDGPVRLNWRIFGDKPPSGDATRPAGKGDLLIVDYRGERTAPESGRSYKDFRVTHSVALIEGDPGAEREPNDPGIDETTAQQIDWDRIGAEAKTEASDAGGPPPIDDGEADGIAAEQAEKETADDDILF